MNKLHALRARLPLRLIEISKITAVTILLFVFVDIVFGAWVISLIRPTEQFRVRHSVYHHSLKPNFDGIGSWGTWTYRVCTNPHGFKDACGSKQPSTKKFDIAFIGDSFTEGVGLPYEQTFVGMVAAKSPNLTIANLGVVSYSPAIYLAKLKALYSEGYQFKHVIVFIDIGDAYDEANAYDLHDNTVVVDKGEPYPLNFAHKVRRFVSPYLPLTGEIWVQLRKLSAPKTMLATQAPLKTTVLEPSVERATSNIAASTAQPQKNNIDSSQARQNIVALASPEAAPAATNSSSPFIKNIYEGIYLKNYPKSEWTYNDKSPHYGVEGVAGTIAKMQEEMQALYALTQSHGTKLSIGVHPWPGQIKYDVVESQQVKIWREFCQSRCENFYNTFPVFFDLAQQQGQDAFIYNYYFQGDVHFNERGNEVIASVLLNAGIK
jgi:hypothetical protein